MKNQSRIWIFLKWVIFSHKIQENYKEPVKNINESFHFFFQAFTWVVPGYLIGGEKKKSEKARIRKGMNILISTPGRLLDHLSSTKNLNLGRLHWLVMDEADRLFDMGYEKDVAK